MLLLVTATALYLWRLDVSGMANEYYSAAAQAGSTSWKALFFGSLDAGGSITVDKPPLALWLMAISVKAFGLSSWSVLVPQALEGVAAVALLHATVKRSTGSAGAALLAGAVFAFTPIAVLIFRYNNPDALLTLLLVAAAYATVRSLESSRAALWLVLSGALVGTAFMDKLLQAFMVLPSLVITYAIFAAAPFGRRIAHLTAAFAALVVAGSWWMLTVDLWPASSRPWIGGSAHNSVLELALGFNGIGRLTGNESAPAGIGSGWHGTNMSRMFGVAVGTGVMWLMPAAIVLGVGGLWWSRRNAAARTPRAALALWLIWLLVNTLVFCLMAGIFHSYYTVVLAPAISALVGTGGLLLWGARGAPGVRGLLVLASASTTVVAVVLHSSHRGQLAGLLPAIIVLGLASVSLLLLDVVSPLVRAATVTLAVAAALLGPAAYSVATASTPHAGSGPQAGPGPGETNPRLPAGLVQMVNQHSDHYRWAAAVGGARSSSALQLATGRPVIAIGGYQGTDPSPSLGRFMKLATTGRVHYFVDGGTSGPAFDTIGRWVRAHYLGQRFGGTAVYDLSKPS